MLFALWGAAALWFRAPAAPLLILALAAATLGSLVLLWRAASPAEARRPGLVLLAVFGALLAWWTAIAARGDRDWIAPLARQPALTVSGDMLRVDDLRDFRWSRAADGVGLGSGEAVAEERWTTRTYDLSALRGVDLFFSYWTGPDIAHLVVSFDFTGEAPLAFSIEIRRERGEAYSALAGFFRSYELTIVAADERDVIRLRTDVWREDVRLYRLQVAPESARRLLLAFAREANSLRERPRWYDTLTANCVTVAFRIAREVWPDLRFDRRILFPGHAPEYAYEIGALGRDEPFAEIARRAAISEAARAATDERFSRAIRDAAGGRHP